ncbi:TetR/AcrR family transcriptional regulator [Parasulfitobacter algicola]|uniref:TetR/AcrR family transcriptional regulator n=1 Tax=Parasulfitobacter algicola TaxID=2614809 RepID=A0ABX2ILZ5_9RHOB|nr:TetR/AcrR family transcriptional regulator [Sulfitobacter algicola]NSX53892.1 TetR/AcrR family transcriptional regulator [Sulfitobacter algicola]
MTDQPSPPRGRPRDPKSHAAVLDAAFTVLEREGYAATTIERIAAQAGVAKQTIYRWWKGKAPLFMEVLARKANQSVQLPDTGSFQGDLTALLTGTFAAVSTTLRPLMRALAVELLQDEEFAGAMRDVFVQRRRANVRALVQQAIGRSELPVDTDVELVCDLVFGIMWYRLMFDHAPLDKCAARQIACAATAAAVQNNV